MANSDTLRTRISEHMASLAEADMIIFDPEAPVVGRVDATFQAFNDQVEPEDRQRQDAKPKLSVFRGGTPEARVYGWTPFQSVTRKSGDALKVRVCRVPRERHMGIPDHGRV